MKKLLLLVLAGCFCSLKAEEIPQDLPAEALASPLTKEERKTSYSYTKFSTSILYQEIGFGKRTRDLELNRASDWSLSLTIFPLSYIQNPYFLVPTIEYAKLFYGRSSSDRYFGLSGSLSFYTVYSKKSGGVMCMPLPNLGLIFGKERKAKGFTQWSINLAPATVLALVHSNSKFNKEVSLYTLGCLVEYTIGF